MKRFRGVRAFVGLAACLAAAPIALACGPSVLERVIVDRVTADGDVILQDQRRVRLAGLHLLGFRAEDWPQPGETVAIGLIGGEPDRWSRHAGLLFALTQGRDPVWLQQHLLEQGRAIVRPEAGLGDCWPLLTGAESAASQKPRESAADPGRFASISGRVQRVGDGRSAQFITLYEPNGARVAGMIQKRHLKRFKDAGVDVAELKGHVIRVRGVRSAANPAVIPLTLAEQIEIVR